MASKMDLMVRKLKEGDFTDHVLEPPHDRQVTCGVITDNVLVTGSADHGLRVWKTRDLSYSKELFSKAYGHKEWVTSVVVLSNGTIVSGGMDGQLCHWEATGVRCKSYTSHETSISKVVADEHDLVLSASYDCTIRVWPFGSRSESRQIALKDQRGRAGESEILIGSHKDPVMEIIFHNSLVVSGDKGGKLVFWDLNQAKEIFSAKAHIQGVNLSVFADSSADSVILTGGLKDGIVQAFDMRSHKQVFSSQQHKGCVTALSTYKPGQFLTASADKTLKLFDLRNQQKPLHVQELSSSVVTAKRIGSAVVLGQADGNISVFDLNELKLLFSFGAMKIGAVSVINATPAADKILIGGDDPTSLVLSMNS